MKVSKITYFNGRGMGEIVRLVLYASNEKFVDERIESDKWPEIKAKYKYGQLPVVTLDNGVQMNESKAIARYVARKFNLYGKDEWETYLIDRAMDTMLDLSAKIALVIYEKDNKKKEEFIKDLNDNHIPHYLGNLTKYIEEGKGQFLAGSSPSLADISLIAVIDNIPQAKPKFPKLMDAYKKTVDAFPAMKKYLATRPETPW